MKKKISYLKLFYLSSILIKHQSTEGCGDTALQRQRYCHNDIWVFVENNINDIWTDIYIYIYVCTYFDSKYIFISTWIAYMETYVFICTLRTYHILSLFFFSLGLPAHKEGKGLCGQEGDRHWLGKDGLRQVSHS